MTRIALVVPSLAGGAPGLEADARGQTLRPDDVVIVEGVRPNGRARNIGVSRTTADIFVFVDDDARLGDAHVIENLVRPLLVDASIGVTGSAKLVPPDASSFQRRVAREVPRIEHAVVETPLETNPPVDHFGHSEITTTCAAMRRDVWERTRGFDEKLVRGVDPEFFRRVRRLGYRFVLVPRTWVWHPAPATLRALLRKQYLYGVGFAQEVRRDPPHGGLRYLHTPLHAAAYLLLRLLWLVPSAFIPWSFSDPRLRLTFRPVGALASFASGVGYVWGWYFDPPRE
ncbi:MAG TPA: glycosyltransferase [Candidatus Saccharimonadaceae bacterium]|jgi:GT2 family glycosyltransferase|nr:glycosyltransferase [Candidatus Saccharimonadaceae bacterium]